MELKELLEYAEKLAKEGNRQKCMIVIMKMVDDYLNDENYSEIEKLFSLLKQENYCPEINLSALSSTSFPRILFEKSRKEFIQILKIRYNDNNQLLRSLELFQC